LPTPTVADATGTPKSQGANPSETSSFLLLCSAHLSAGSKKSSGSGPPPSWERAEKLALELKLELEEEGVWERRGVCRIGEAEDREGGSREVDESGLGRCRGERPCPPSDQGLLGTGSSSPSSAYPFPVPYDGPPVAYSADELALGLSSTLGYSRMLA